MTPFFLFLQVRFVREIPSVGYGQSGVLFHRLFFFEVGYSSFDIITVSAATVTVTVSFYISLVSKVNYPSIGILLGQHPLFTAVGSTNLLPLSLFIRGINAPFWRLCIPRVTVFILSLPRTVILPFYRYHYGSKTLSPAIRSTNPSPLLPVLRSGEATYPFCCYYHGYRTFHR